MVQCNHKRKGEIVMKYRVFFEDGKFFPCYFYRKRDAVACQQERGCGVIQRKIGGEWCNY